MACESQQYCDTMSASGRREQAPDADHICLSFVMILSGFPKVMVFVQPHLDFDTRKCLMAISLCISENLDVADW